MRDLLIAEICKYRPQLPREIIVLKTKSIEVLKRKAKQSKDSYFSSDEGDVLTNRLNIID